MGPALIRDQVGASVENRIHYLNTDLDLTSAEDLTPFSAILEACGFFLVKVRCHDGLWTAVFEAGQQYEEAGKSIEEMVATLESLQEPWRSVFLRCTTREFNIGYECGPEPWAFNQGLSNKLLGRMSSLGASLRVTLYPNREPAGEQG